MAYLGNRELSIEAQDRVMSAFRKVIANLQQRQREEALIGLEFVLRIDPLFGPAIELKRQLQRGAEAIDLTDLIAQIEAPTTETINELLIEAVEDFNNRNFVAAKSKVEQVLLELPGHQEARRLLNQLQESLKVEQQVGQFLIQAREALATGDPQEAANFVLMAQALDPHHGGIAPTLQEIYASSGAHPTDLSPRRPAVRAGGPAAPAAAVSDRTSAAASGGRTAGAADAPWGTGGDELFGDGLGAAEFPGPDFGAELLTDTLDIDLGPPAVDLGPLPGDDVSDLFDAARPAGAPPSSDQPVVAQLLARGTAALDAGQHLAAIDAWSRIWLEDPTNEEVGARVAEAKRRLEQAGRELEHLLFEAEDALIGGDKDKALELVNRVLMRHPGHREAIALHRRLSGEPEPAAAPAPAPVAAAAGPEMPDLEEDLFSEPLAEVDAASRQQPSASTFVEAEEGTAMPAPRRMLAVSPRKLALAVLAVVVLAVVAVLGVNVILGARKPTAENDVDMLRTEANKLYSEGKPAAALQLVERFRPRNDDDEKVVGVLRAKYTAALATPTPTPVPQIAIEAQRMLAAGQWFRAYDEAKRGLESYPSDRGLLAIIEQVEAQEPLAASLSSQLAARNHRGAAGTARDLLATHAGQPDLFEVLKRSLFNAALAELRTYNLTGARSLLGELNALGAADDEVNRVLEFIDSYKARPVDMQLKVFIQSLPERLTWSAPAAPPPAVAAQPTPTPAIPA
jgi:hypothetical protein